MYHHVCARVAPHLLTQFVPLLFCLRQLGFTALPPAGCSLKLTGEFLRTHAVQVGRETGEFSYQNYFRYRYVSREVRPMEKEELILSFLLEENNRDFYQIITNTGTPAV